MSDVLLQIDGVDTWVSADDPRVPKPLPPEPEPAPLVSGDAIIGAIAKADRAKCDPIDLARIAWRDDVPAGNPKLGRVAKAIGTTPDALRALVLSGA